MKITIIVLDSLGIGELPDASKYGDAGADTIGHILDNYKLNIPNLRGLGFGNIERPEDPMGKGKIAGGRLTYSFCDNDLIDTINLAPYAYGRLAEKSVGKDTITGHWEIAGIETDIPFKTYYDGFPKELMDEFVKQTGRGYLGNCVASGTDIIERLGEEHERTGKVIVYTSADSVFQIAANTEVVHLSELYSICEKARGLLQGKYSCGRVIARPYIKNANGKRVRTSDRRDYSVSPPIKTMLDIIEEDGNPVYAIGKINDIFNGNGITEAIHIEDNDDGVTKTIETMHRVSDGLIFTNLVDFDSKFGHRRDVIGYGKAIEAFDKRLPEIVEAMGANDILILCSDHGNDPIHEGFDHTREYIFCICAGKCLNSNVNLGTRQTFADIGATVTDILTEGRKTTSNGESFKNLILKK